MRLPILGPRDTVRLLERGVEAADTLLGAVPRLVSLIAEAEILLERTNGLITRIEATREAADAVVLRTGAVVTRAEALVDQTDPLTTRLGRLLDATEPSLVKLQPTLDRLAETTDPREVDALVMLVDHLPLLAAKMETDVIPIMESLTTVAPDLHELLDVSRELNEMLAKVPGVGRMLKRNDEDD